MISITTIISAIGFSFAALPLFALFTFFWIRQYKRRLKSPGLSSAHIQKATAGHLTAIVICVALCIFSTLPWRAALQAYQFDWRNDDSAAIQVEEYVYEGYERQKLRTVILDDRDDIERILAAIEAMEAAPAINHEGGPAREYVVGLCRSSGLMSPYSISIALGPVGKPFSEIREYNIHVGLEGSNLNRGQYRSDALVQLLKQRLGQDEVLR